MPSQRQEQISNSIKETAAKFFQEESNHTSMITVTRADVSPDLKNATIFITVLPTEKEEGTLGFCLRKRSDLKKYMKNNMYLKIIPFVNIEIDSGEKHRQRVEELLRKD